MHRLFGFENPDCFTGGCLSIGNFDGVHVGHQRMLGALVEMSRRLSVPAVVMTFDPPPIQILAPERTPPRITSIAQKADLIERSGVDCLILYPTDKPLLQLSPTEFFDQIVLQKVKACGLVEGPNFFFGRDRAGTVETLKSLGAAASIGVQIIDPQLTPLGLISSTAIRQALKQGDIAAANQMLGRPYELQGTVGTGSKRGRELGFPTANLEQIASLLPADGVYAGAVFVGEVCYAAAIHIGPNPTFGEDQRKVEVHLIGYSGQLYGAPLSVTLSRRLRDLRSFASREELVSQLNLDIAAATE